MADQITIAKLKEQFKDKGGAVGQVVNDGGLNRYVVVEETSTGVRVMALYGTFLGGDATERVIDVNDNEDAFLEDRATWKSKFKERWDEIAAKYPAINVVQ